MKNVLLAVGAVIVFITLNFAIYQKQQILKSGETIYLQIEPRDPRSIIQGDYMAFQYAMEREPKDINHDGYFVIKPDENKIGQFVRIHKGENLAPDEKLIKFKMIYSYPRIHPNTYLFQEGKGPALASAQYAVFRYNGTKDYLLVGMADAERKILSGSLVNK